MQLLNFLFILKQTGRNLINCEIAAVPVNHEYCEVIMPEMEIDGLYFHETLTISKNGFPETEIINRFN